MPLPRRRWRPGRCPVLAPLFVLAVLLVPSLAAQIEPPSTGGATVWRQELRMLGHRERVLMIGAHPDDEASDLLAVLVRGMGVESAYLSLNRGEGGQNLIGSELGEALGLLRTEELLSARQLDGAQQFFTRAYDFGFSKTLADAWAHWPRDSVLKDVVRIVRRFRPQVIVSVFSGTPRDGHGQHQAAGWAAQEAFRIAGDSARFPELRVEEGLEPWTPLKLYRIARSDTAGVIVTLEAGTVDPAVGRSYHQIAMQGRSRHRSQDMGALQAIGPAPTRLLLWQDRTSGGASGLFGGIDTTLATFAAAGAAGREPLASLGRAMAGADSLDPAGLDRLRARFLSVAGDTLHLDVGLREQLGHLDVARASLAGILCDATADDDQVVPGQLVRMSASCAGGAPVALVVRDREGKALGADLTYRVPELAPSQPYFLAAPRQGDLYDWSGVPPELRGLPREPPLFTLEYAGIRREVSFRFNDQGLGEQRRPITIVPRVDVKIDPDTLLLALAPGARARFRVTLTHGARDSTSGRVRLLLPAGWGQVPPQSFDFSRENESASFDFAVAAPAALRAGTVDVRAEAEDSHGRRFARGSYTIAYAHIRSRSYSVPAVARVVTAALSLPRLAHVGYVRGAADRVPEALRAVGIPVELLDAAALATGDLSHYDAIVIGPRAYEVDTALVAHNNRLLDYARAGGYVLVQYQQYEFVRGRFAPFPLTIANPHDRVTDENAPVRLLDPGAAAFQRPNPIGEDDWRGWVQERGLYFAHSWDPAYHPLLESHDPGEGAQEGGLLMASVGRGTYVYTGLAFFRELPAGVPGAYRLFANLLALGRRPSP